MNRAWVKVAFLAAGALCAAGFVVWPGCAAPPLPASRTPLSIHTRDEFSLKKNEHPSRAEIVTKLGKPDEYFADLRVACYKLNEIKRRRLLLLFGFLPIAAPRDPARLEVVLIQFDDRDRAQREKIRIIPGYYIGVYGNYQSTMPAPALRSMMKSEAQQWLNQTNQSRR